MSRTVYAKFSIDETEAIEKDTGTLDYFEREAGWMNESGIYLQEAMQAEYGGCSTTCVVNGNEGKFIVYNNIRKAEPVTIETTRDSSGMEIERINLDNWDKIMLPTDITF